MHSFQLHPSNRLTVTVKTATRHHARGGNVWNHVARASHVRLSDVEVSDLI